MILLETYVIICILPLKYWNTYYYLKIFSIIIGISLEISKIIHFQKVGNYVLQTQRNL